MAVITEAQGSKLKLQFDAGLDGKGNTIIKSKTYSKLKSDAINDDVYDVATSLVGLQALPIESIRRIDEVEIVEE